jgi:hypothetical protein
MLRANDSRPCTAKSCMDARTRRRRLPCWPWRRVLAPLMVCGIGAAGCGDKTPPPPPACEQACQDGVALRAVREMMKFAFNFTFQTQSPGFHDLTTERFLRGSARVFGTASSDGEQGVTDVDLTYVFTQAVYPKKEDDADENYVIGLDGTITQVGKIAVQPSSPTALKMKGELVRVVGTVYDPPINYVAQPDGGAPEMGCALEILQNGNSVSGMFCDRVAGFEF